MKLETFFEKFDQFADAPDAVVKMRELVLGLAVLGKLVPQDPNDEPADSILQATQSFFQRSVAAKKLSPPKPLPPVEDSEVPFSLPSGWAWSRLGQVMRISSGDGLIAKDMIEGPFPVYGGNGVNGYHDKHNVAKRTLVIGRVGFYCGSIHITPERAWVTDNAFITTFDEEHVDMDFLSWLLKATDLRERDNATAQPVISGGKIYPTVLALPPLAEQKRIVAKVDELMALCDRLEAQQQERETRHAALARASLARFADAPTPANLTFLFHKSYNIPPADFRKSILTLAIQGKLVPQDPDDEPAAEFVRQLQVERKNSFEAEAMRARDDGLRQPRPPRNGFLPYVTVDRKDLPDKWCTTRIGDVSDCLDYLRVPVNKEARLAASGTVPYYGANGQVGWIDKHLFDEDLVLVVEDESFVGRVKPFSYVIRGKSWVNNHAHVLRPLGGMEADFLNLILCRYPFIPLTSGTTNRRKLTQPSLMDATIALPPLAEQRRIMAKVEQLMALVDALETQIAASRTTAANLLSALVAELTGTPNNGKPSVPSATTTGRRGRPPKS
jgi:type I restriction enzyme S subunit